MAPRYEPRPLEAKWQKIWEERGLFNAPEDPARPKYYVLEMFPYPSGRIHMGHVRNYTIGDVVARYKRMRGFNVLHPMGWDAFGLPAENAAMARGLHPAAWTYDNIEYMRRQLKELGYSYDWRRELATCDPDYYRWEQLVFIEMFRRGLAYKKEAPVNWCPKCATVLANEQVEEGLCWRCDSPVHLKELNQWFFKITAYAEELLADLDQLTHWPERVLTMQRHWIGKSPGAEIYFPLRGARGGEPLTVFTTRADTLFGATFMSLAPEHPLALALAQGTGQEEAVGNFVEYWRAQNRSRGVLEEVTKEGVFTGSYCTNPVTGRQMPIYVANFVLMEYGTGAVMAVPAHDQRDFEFAQKYDLPIQVVIQPRGRSLRPTPSPRRTRTKASWWTPASSPVWPAPRPRRPSPPFWKRRARVRARCTSACGTGSSPGSATGGRPSPSFTARPAAWRRCRRKTCPWSCPWRLPSPGRAAPPWRSCRRSMRWPAPPATARPGGKWTPWTPSWSPPGTSCATPAPTTPEASWTRPG